MSVKIPFVNSRDSVKPDDGFMSLLKTTICPHYQLISITSVLIAICLLVFIVMHILYPPGGYSTFLQLPTQMDKLTLDITAFKNNKAKFYTLVTAMFIHYSYRHIMMNMLFAVFILYELEYCWKWSIPLALLAGFAANCLAVVTMNGMVLGFSGVLTAAIGIIIAALILHCSYLRAVYSTQFCMVCVMMVLMLVFILALAPAGVIHLFGILFGILFGLAFYPTMQEAQVNPNVEKLFKIFSVSFLALAVLLAFTA